jgi:DNA-directed RNA polymerase subunit beta'
MGHIKLVVPVVHIWYFKSLPNKTGYMLGLSSKNVEAIVYYERYVVIQAGVTEEGVPVNGESKKTKYLDLINRRRIFRYFRWLTKRQSIVI